MCDNKREGKMAIVKKSDCFYGGALSWLFSNKIHPALIYMGDHRQEYEFTTNEKPFVLFMMYRMENSTERKNYSSWAFGDIRQDVADLEKYRDQGKNPVLALICIKRDLQRSEIAFLFHKDILQIKDKKSISISRKKNEKQFRIPIDRDRENSWKINCDPDFSTVDL